MRRIEGLPEESFRESVATTLLTGVVLVLGWLLELLSGEHRPVRPPDALP